MDEKWRDTVSRYFQYIIFPFVIIFYEYLFNYRNLIYLRDISPLDYTNQKKKKYIFVYNIISITYVYIYHLFSIVSFIHLQLWIINFTSDSKVQD